MALAVDDDPDRQQVTMNVIHPRTVYDIERDKQGNCRAYDLRDLRQDPRWPDELGLVPEVTYREIAYRQGDRVVYETYLDNEPWDWRDYEPGMKEVGPTWSEDYGFVPFVFLQHRDMGLGFGWSEFQPSLGKMLELDETVSNIADQIGKGNPGLLSGITRDESGRGSTDDDPDDDTSADRGEERRPAKRPGVRTAQGGRAGARGPAPAGRR